MNEATTDALAIQTALLALEDEYNIPRSNPLHTLLLEMRDKYADTLGIEQDQARGGGTNKD